MTNELPPSGVKNVWQGQAVESTSMSLEDIRKRIRKLERMARRRHIVGVSACLIAMASFALSLAVLPMNAIQRIGAALTILGTGYGVYQLLLIRKRPKGATAAGTEPAACLEFCRAELERQRDFHRGLWFWSRMVTFAPGPLIFYVGSAIAQGASARSTYLHTAVFVLLGILPVHVNLRRARKYQHEIDALDGSEKKN